MRLRIAVLVFLVVTLAACAKPATPPLNPVATQTLVPGPTYTPTPETPLVILVIPADTPKDRAALYQKTIYDLAQANGLRFQLLNSLTTQDIQREGSAIKVVVSFPPDPGLADLVMAAPAVQFLAVNTPGLPAAPNLTTLGADGVSIDQQAFMAGYIAAMLVPDYHIGILTLKDTNGLMAETAFKNGMSYYCGMCQPAFGPFYPYPISIEIPVDENPKRYMPYSDPLVNYQVTIAYVYPPIATTDLLEYMSIKELQLIGEEMPAQDLQSSWIVSLKPEWILAIQQIFPELLKGQGGQLLPVPFSMTDINSSLFSEGKQRLVQETLDDLQAGYISTGVNP